MDELKNAFVSMKTPESSLFKLLQGFSMERSIDGSTLFISTANKSEQIIALNILSAINRQIRISDYKDYMTPQSVTIPSANLLLKKMAHYGIETKLDSSEVINCIESVSKEGAKIKYEFSYLDQAHFLRIEGLKPASLDRLVASLKDIKIEIGKNQIYGSKDGIVIEGEQAKRIAERLADRNINFEGRRFLPSQDSQLTI